MQLKFHVLFYGISYTINEQQLALKKKCVYRLASYWLSKCYFRNLDIVLTIFRRSSPLRSRPTKVPDGTYCLLILYYIKKKRSLKFDFRRISLLYVSLLVSLFTFIDPCNIVIIVNLKVKLRGYPIVLIWFTC